MPYIDFSEVKSRVSIHQAAEMLGLMLKPEKQQLRGICPACNAGGDRALVLTPDRGLFFCFAGRKGGDCIELVCHITGMSKVDAAQFLIGESNPEPKREQKAERPFDPNAFAQKLTYSEEVKALGISQEDAERLLVGYHPQRKAVYFGLRNPDGSPSGFIAFKDGKLVMPPRWIGTNIVRLKRPA